MDFEEESARLQREKDKLCEQLDLARAREARQEAMRSEQSEPAGLDLGESVAEIETRIKRVGEKQEELLQRQLESKAPGDAPTRTERIVDDLTRKIEGRYEVHEGIASTFKEVVEFAHELSKQPADHPLGQGDQPPPHGRPDDLQTEIGNARDGAQPVGSNTTPDVAASIDLGIAVGIGVLRVVASDRFQSGVSAAVQQVKDSAELTEAQIKAGIELTKDAAVGKYETVTEQLKDSAALAKAELGAAVLYATEKLVEPLAAHAPPADMVMNQVEQGMMEALKDEQAKKVEETIDKLKESAKFQEGRIMQGLVKGDPDAPCEKVAKAAHDEQKMEALKDEQARKVAETIDKLKESARFQEGRIEQGLVKGDPDTHREKVADAARQVVERLQRQQEAERAALERAMQEAREAMARQNDGRSR